MGERDFAYFEARVGDRVSLVGRVATVPWQHMTIGRHLEAPDDLVLAPVDARRALAIFVRVEGALSGGSAGLSPKRVGSNGRRDTLLG